MLGTLSLIPDRLCSAVLVLLPVMRANLSPQANLGLGLLELQDAEGDNNLSIVAECRWAPVDVVGCVDGPAGRVAQRLEPGHVAVEIGEALAAAGEHALGQLAAHSFGRILRAHADGVLEVPETSLGIFDLELERLRRPRRGEGEGRRAFRGLVMCSAARFTVAFEVGIWNT